MNTNFVSDESIPELHEPQNESLEQSTETLYKGRVFTTWDQAFNVIEGWAKQNGFNIIYNHIERKPDRIFCKRTVQCEY